MRCREAARRMVRHVAGVREERPDYELEEHLRLCPECSRRLEVYRRIRRDVQEMVPTQPPQELDEFLAEGIRKAFERPMDLERPPASPDAEAPGHWKGAIVLAALVSVLAGLILLGLLFGPEPEPEDRAGAVSFVAGTVEVLEPGAKRWHAVQAGQGLLPGMQVRTGSDGLAKVRGDGVTWWLGGMAHVALVTMRSAELAAGRLYAECADSPAEPYRLITAFGTAESTGGAFVAAMSLKRLRLGCAAGSVAIGEGERAVRLTGGQCTVLEEKGPAGPVRPVRVSELTHFLREFEERDGRRPTARQLACVPVAPAEPALPGSVRIADLAVRLKVRGPLALLEVKAVLRNEGEEAWDGRLALADALLPPPIVEAPAGRLALAPGAEGECRAAALFLMRNRSGAFDLGWLPSVWTARPIERMTVSVDATADGGVRAFRCPALGAGAKRPGTVRWPWEGSDVPADTPIVFEFELARPETLDVLHVGAGPDACALIAWRPDAPREEWLGKGRNIFLAFDAAADFGPGGRASAHDALEVLLGSLPPASTTALLAYDGALKLDRSRLNMHLPARAEMMLSALWALRDGGEPQTARFLREAAACAVAAEGEGLLIFVTGRDEPGDLSACSAELAGSGVRVAVVQVGAARPADAYRALCAASGGVALALPPRAVAELSAIEFPANLRVPGVRRAGVAAPGGVAGAVLAGPGRFASQPVLALVLGQGRGEAQAVLNAEAGGREFSRRVALKFAGREAAGDRITAELARRLRRRVLPANAP